MGKLEPYIDPLYYDVTRQNLIFDQVFNSDGQKEVKFMNNISNCCGNFIYKTYAIDNTNVTIAKLWKPIHTYNHKKLKITCINYHDSDDNIDIASYCRLCDEGDIEPLISGTSYNWGNTEKSWQEMFSGSIQGSSYYISTTIVDLTKITEDKTLYIGIHQGASKTDCTAYCGIVEIELQ